MLPLHNIYLYIIIYIETCLHEASTSVKQCSTSTKRMQKYGSQYPELNK